jgi:hypothetical protein
MARDQTLNRRARLGELSRPSLGSASLLGLLRRLKRQHDSLQVVGQIVVATAARRLGGLPRLRLRLIESWLS